MQNVRINLENPYGKGCYIMLKLHTALRGVQFETLIQHFYKRKISWYPLRYEKKFGVH